MDGKQFVLRALLTSQPVQVLKQELPLMPTENNSPSLTSDVNNCKDHMYFPQGEEKGGGFGVKQKKRANPNNQRFKEKG